MMKSAVGTGPFLLAGCLGDDEVDGDEASDNPNSEPSGDGTGIDEYVFVASVLDDPEDVARDWEPLADWLETKTGTPTRIDPVQNDSAAISALAAGQAHLAYPSGGPAWVGWQNFGLETLVVEADQEGQAFYTAAAWVRADSDIQSIEDLEGVDSCHTGNLTGAGMLIPMATLAHEGLVTFEDDDDITAIRAAVDEFFGEPVVGGGYIGALRCLSEGIGDVAFVRASSPEDFCGGDDPEDWCLDLDEYRPLAGFAEVPSHPIMVNPEMSDAQKAELREALLALNEEPDGKVILDEVLGVHQLNPSTSEEHLGAYGELLEILPGIEDHLLE